MASPALALEALLHLSHCLAVRRGGKRVQPIAPGPSAEGLLISTLRHEPQALPQPPDERLPASIHDFVGWIEWGTPDPREPAAAFSVGVSALA